MADILTIENMLASPVHSLFPASPIFSYGSVMDPSSPPHYSSEERVTPKIIPNPCQKPPNLVPYVLYDPDSYPSSSYSSLLVSSDSSDDDYYKQRQHTKKDKKKLQSKNRFNDPLHHITHQKKE